MDALLRTLAVLFVFALVAATGAAVFSEDVGAAHTAAGSVSYENSDPVPATRRFCRDNVLNEDGALVWCDGMGPQGASETDFHHYLLVWADVNGYCDCLDTYTGVLSTLGLIDV